MRRGSIGSPRDLHFGIEPPSSVADVHGERYEPLTIAERVAVYEDEARAWHARYRRPFWVAETYVSLAARPSPPAVS